ncbi:hypothetical protein E2C01_097612 [Portunus trituberculatus]|uniref:Uncharacterized protein n=1 Tax=Portunus trituberculatus TaxID=210409 RepID=A0A5B7K655_PORTR|nr:hypothetical protein [Portunus trituberculatus]
MCRVVFSLVLVNQNSYARLALLSVFWLLACTTVPSPASSSSIASSSFHGYT